MKHMIVRNHQVKVMQGLAPNSRQRVLTPNSGHFLCRLLHFWSDSVHTGRNLTGIITYNFRNKERYSFQILNIPKNAKKSISMITAPFVFCFLRWTISSFSSWKLALCGILLFLQNLIVRSISVWVESVVKWNSYLCPELGVKTRCLELGANPYTQYL